LEIEADRTMVVLQSIKEILVEMLLKLQEVDEVTTEIQVKGKLVKPPSFPLPDLISGNMTTEQILKLLEEKVKLGMIASGQFLDGHDSGVSDTEEVVVAKPALLELPVQEEIERSELEPYEEEEGQKLPKSPSVMTDFGIDEKPATYPQVYSSLITGRSTGLVSSASPGGGGPGGGSEEEADVPSRSFLKRQANLIIDAKSRRKFRQQQPASRRK
jgi:coiled-coil domain-containing protein 151